MKSGESRADANRRVRREALRDQLEAKGLVQKVIETAEQLVDLSLPMDSVEVQRLRAGNDARLKLINKYLPDAKDDQNLNIGGNLGLTDMTEAELDRRLEQLEQATKA
jgi:hypothetical protein